GAFAGLLFKTIFGDDCPVVAEANNLPYDIRLSLNNGGIPSFRFGYYGLRTTVRIKKCLNDSPSQYPSL
ncbi:MAG: hypothetical protein U9Q05_14325, partial [Thermodesulfobacteriota bacterium]|nr:hypothetical protein [Thermodesulfobacteriota bacterium]